MKLLILMISLSSLNLFAQVDEPIYTRLEEELTSFGREGGGGDTDPIETIYLEVLMKERISTLVNFFNVYPEAKSEFTEISFEDFFELAKNIELIIVDGPIKDRHGVERTAVNYPSKEKIEFDREKLHGAKDKKDVLLVLAFHELLGIMGLEHNDPKRDDLYMNYEISGKLVKYLVKKITYDLEYKPNRDPIFYEGCKLSIHSYFGRFHDYTRRLMTYEAFTKIISEKGYKIVKHSGGDFTLGIHSVLDYSGYVAASLVHKATQFDKVLSGRNRKEEIIVHRYNKRILRKIGLAKNVNQVARLQALLRPELNKKQEAMRGYIDMANKLPTCKEMLGE